MIDKNEDDKLDKCIDFLNVNGLGGLLSGPWIDKYQEEYNQKVIDYMNGNGEKPDFVFV